MRNIIASDAPAGTVDAFRDGVAESSGLDFAVESAMTARKPRTPLRSAMIQLGYVLVPFKWYRRRRSIDVLVGWQQFFAVNYALWHCLTRARKRTRVVVVNFTYKKRAGGVMQRLYHKYMSWVCRSPYIDVLHVLSPSYADECAATLGVDRAKFAVTPFGVTDRREAWLATARPLDEPYVLSVGRSNRDFDLLVRLWSQPALAGRRLVILSDTWHPAGPLPPNVTHLDNVTGEAATPYFAHAAAAVVPVDHPNLCSGDTVLLNSMMMGCPTIITAPSTLAEMYIEDGVDGLCISRDEAEAARIAALLDDRAAMAGMGRRAREKFLERFTLRGMGRSIGALVR